MAMPDDLFTPTAIVEYEAETWRVEATHPTELHLVGQKDPERFTVLFRSEVQGLLDAGRLAVRDEIPNHLDFSIMTETTRKRAFSNLIWVQTAEQARMEGRLANYSRSSLAQFIKSEAENVIRKYKDFLANQSTVTPTLPRKAHYGSFSERRSNQHSDIDQARLIPSAKTLKRLITLWLSHRDIRALIPGWGNQVGGGRQIDARTWSFIENNCMRYARETNRSISACREFINALISEENQMHGPDARIARASEHAIKKAIASIPEFAKLFTRRGPARMEQSLRHVGSGPKFTRLGEEVDFDCWDVHLFTLLQDEVLEMFPGAIKEVRLTLCAGIDLATDYVPGFAIAPTGETATLACRALEMVGTDKKALALAAGAKGNWEAVAIEAAGTDNGSAFWNALFLHALYVLADVVDHKAAGHKRLRAKIERLLRKLDKKYLQNFIAQTGSNILDRHENDPEKRSGIYADFFTRLFVRYIVDVYHYTPIGKGRNTRPSPARALEAARKIQCKALPGPHLKRIAHGLVTERTLNRAGIRFMNIVYYSTWLDRPLWDKGSHEVKIKYHPRNLGCISVLLNKLWVTIPGPRELDGTDLQTWLDYNDQLAREVNEQAEVDFKTIVAPAIIAIDAGARRAERELNLTDLDWTDAMASEAERRLRTFMVYDRDVIGAEQGLSGRSDLLGTAVTRRSVALPAEPGGDPSAPRPEQHDETTDLAEGRPQVRKQPRTRKPIS